MEKEIGQVWRQMGIMYGQLSNSIGILEKVSKMLNIFIKQSIHFHQDNILIFQSIFKLENKCRVIIKSEPLPGGKD